MSETVKVLGISNAVVDILTHVEEDFLQQIGAPKHSMVLIDAQRAEEVYARMGPATEKSGGSVANTIAGIANLGGRTAYIGRVRDDDLGRIFVHDLRSLGVDVRLQPAATGAPTARSYILITPDGERTMQTYLGACTELDVEDIDARTVGRAEVMLLEGYIWDTPQGPAVADKAIRQLAAAGGGSVALSLSDDELVGRHRAEFDALIGDAVKMVFANESEIVRLFGVDDFAAAVEQAARRDALFVLTRSEKGSLIVHGAQRVAQAAYPVERVVDATGAGDAYTAAFLYGWTNGRSLAECADRAARCASGVIQQLGARIERR